MTVPSSWTRLGKTNVYTCKQGAVTGRITCRVNGSSKCLFKFTGLKLTLQPDITSLPDVPVRLQLGDDFDQTVVARGMTVKNHAARMTSAGPLPLFYIEKLTVIRNLKQAGRDSLVFKGRLFLSTPFDPNADALAMDVGPHSILVPAGAWVKAGNGLRYKPTRQLTVQLIPTTGALSITASGIDFSAVTTGTHVSLSVANHAGADWDYGFLLSVNKAGTVYKY